MSQQVEIYDTTLRDGTQQEGISLTAGDKLRGGPPARRPRSRLRRGRLAGRQPQGRRVLRSAPRPNSTCRPPTLVAFGSTRRSKDRPEDDEQLAALLAAETDVICLVGKSWDYHVEHALRTTLDEAVAMVADSVEYLRSQGRRVFFDAEHFFDGYRDNPELRPGGPAGSPRSRRRTAGAVRHQRRFPLPRGGAHRRRGHRSDPRRRLRLPLPQRLRDGGRQLAHGRPDRRLPGPGLHQRLRRTHRQRRPVLA